MTSTCTLNWYYIRMEIGKRQLFLGNTVDTGTLCQHLCDSRFTWQTEGPLKQDDGD